MEAPMGAEGLKEARGLVTEMHLAFQSLHMAIAQLSGHMERARRCG